MRQDRLRAHTRPSPAPWQPAKSRRPALCVSRSCPDSIGEGSSGGTAIDRGDSAASFLADREAPVRSLVNAPDVGRAGTFLTCPDGVLDGISLLQLVERTRFHFRMVEEQ